MVPGLVVATVLEFAHCRNHDTCLYVSERISQAMMVQLVGCTAFMLPKHDRGEWYPEIDENGDTEAGGQDLIEFAGRACYQSWGKPNPDTATNRGYVRHIVEVDHASVLEHSVASFYITGVSRSLTHELVRHRHFSYSQLSQRYVDECAAKMLRPAMGLTDAEHTEFRISTELALKTYRNLYENARLRMSLKEARGLARSVLPNATETRLVMTGNMRAWRDMLHKRLAPQAEREIRALARMLLVELSQLQPDVFADMVYQYNAPERTS